LLVLRPYWNAFDLNWHFYIPVRPGELGRIAGGEPVVGSYFASTPADSLRDREWPLGSLIVRHLSFPHVIPALDRFEHRYYQLCVSLEKYAACTRYSKDADSSLRLLLASELEYVLITVRTLYDLLQKVVQRTAALVRTPNDLRRLIADLPDSFARIVLNGETLRTEKEISDRFGLPQPLASFYAVEGIRFQLLRDLRDGVVHHGKGVPTIYETEAGVGVAVDESPWNQLKLWTPENLRHGKFGSVRAIFAHLTFEALEMITRFAIAYSSCIAVPESILSDVRLYLRHPFGRWLVNLEKLIDQPWEGELL
jgi:hypothetical protein